MGKQVNIQYFVKVDPVVGFLEKSAPESERRDCARIIAEIKRHVDVGDVYLEIKEENVCEYCGYTWTEDGDTYNGGCCKKDAEAADE